MQAKIYKIRSLSTDLVYIGSTTMSLASRFSTHKSHYNRYLLGKHNYITSFEIIKFTDCYIELVCDVVVADKTQLKIIEGSYIINSENCINKHVAGRTKQESKRQYRLNNRDYIMESCVCNVCNVRYSRPNKARHLKSNKHKAFNAFN
jgi:hypothetical protein